MSTQTKICQWKAVFELSQNKISVRKITDLPNLKLLTQYKVTSKYITGIEVTTPPFPFTEAILYSKLVANRCIDYISFIVGYGISCHLRQINEMGPQGNVKTGATMFSLDTILAKPEEIDITRTSFQNILNDKDEKLSRQFSHYRRGLNASDEIEAIREFYQVLEDEYPKEEYPKHPLILKYKYARNLVNHPILTEPTSERKAKQILGKSYFDPSSPQDIAALQKYLQEIKDEAKKIIETKI